jgi:hypothetical protein
MANSDKNIKITPNISQTAQPNVVFTGQGNVPITLKVLDDAYGTLSFEGSSGQLFSINNNLTSGVIFSVNDVSGVPMIDVDASGLVRLAPLGGTTYSNTLYGVPRTVAGSGNSVTIRAADGLTSGAGGNILLQPGQQATTGGDGRLIVRQPNGTAGTNEVQMWHDGSQFHIKNFTAVADYGTSSSIILKSSNDFGVQIGRISASTVGVYPVGTNTIAIGNPINQTVYAGWWYSNYATGAWEPNNSSYPINWTDVGFYRGSKQQLIVGNSSSGGGSLAYTANTPSALSANTNDLALGGSAFQRLSSSATYNLTGIAPPSTGAHVDGRVIWLHNVGSFNITLKHSQTSVAANQFINENGGDIVLGPNRIVQCTYDGTSTKWRVHGEMYPYNMPTVDGTSGQLLSTNGSGTLSWASGGGSGTVTSVSGTGTVNGITLTGTVTSSGSLALGGSLSGVNLASQVTGTLPIANGGTGATTAAAAYNALSPMTTLGDITYEASGGSAARLAGNTTATKQFLVQTGTGTVSAAPAWAAIAAADVPTLNQNTTGTASGSVSGTASYVPKFTSANVVGNSLIYDSGSHIGIGTTTLNQIGGTRTVSINGSTDAGVELNYGNVVSGTLYANSNGFVLGGFGAIGTRFTTGSTSAAAAERMRIDTSGNVGIGNTSPGAKLQIDTGAAGTKGLIVKAAATPTANILEVQNSSGTNLVYVDPTGDLAVGVPNATYFPSGPGAPLHVTRPTTAVATAIAAWPTYEPDTQTHARVTAFFTDGGNGGTATLATGTTTIIKFGEYYTARVVLMPEGAGGQTPADQNSGSGRDIMLLGGKSDNAAGKTGGRVFIQGGTGFAGAYGSNFGDVILQANGGRVCVGGTSPVSTSPGLDITADASSSATGQLMIKRASTNDRFRLTCGVHTSNYAFIKAYENAIGAINLALQPDVGSVGIGTTSPSDKLHVIGNVRAGNYTYGYLAMTGDLPGYANGSYPTLKSDNTIYFSADGKYSAYLGDASKNIFALLHPTALTANVLLNPNGTSYFTGGSVAFGATTAAGGGQAYVAPTSNATKGLVVRGAASQSANLQEWQNTGGTVLSSIDSSGNASFPTASTTLLSSNYTLRKSFARTLPNVVGDYVELTRFANYGISTFRVHVVVGWGPGESGINKSYLFNNYQLSLSGIVPPINQSTNPTHDCELEIFYEAAGTAVLRLRRSKGTTSAIASVLIEQFYSYGGGGSGSFSLDERTGTGTSAIANSYITDYRLSNRLQPTMTAVDPPGSSGNGTGVTLSAGTGMGTGVGGNFTVVAGSAATTGAGGSIILQPGAQVTSGGNGTITFNSSAGTAISKFSTDSSTLTITTQSGAAFALKNSTGTTVLSVSSAFLTLGASLDCNSNTLANVGSIYANAYAQFAVINPKLQFPSNVPTAAIENGSTGQIRVSNASTGGGSFAFTSSSPGGYTGDQTDLALSGSAFQRLSGTAARNIFSIAPPSGGSHVDGRMIRIYNVGSFNLTLKHNYTTGTTQANRMFCVQSVDIIIAANDFAELIYDATNNGSGAAGWRVA